MNLTDSSLAQVRHDPCVLLGPGSSNLHPHVSQAMTCPILGHLYPEFLVILDDTMVLLRHLF